MSSSSSLFLFALLFLFSLLSVMSASASAAGPNPFITSITDCTRTDTAGATIYGCNGGTWSDTLTIRGGNFLNYPSVTVQGKNKQYTMTTQSFTTNTTIYCSSWNIDAADVNTSIPLTVSNTAGGVSNTWYVQFTTAATDDSAVTAIASTVVAIIAVVTIVGVCILIGVIAGIASCFCGVSFAFLRCCQWGQWGSASTASVVTSTPIYRPQAYVAMSSPTAVYQQPYIPGQGYVAYRV